MPKITKLLVLSISLLFPLQLFAQENNSVFQFLQLQTSPRLSAIGGKSVSFQQGDLFSTLSNPAYYDSSFHNQAQFVYFNHLADAGMSSLAYGYAIENIGLLTTHLRYMNYGEFSGYDELGNVVSEFNVYDLALSVSLSREIIKNLFAGSSVNFIRSSIQHFQSHGATLTMGLYYFIPTEDLSLGFTIQDIGTQFDSYNGTRENIKYQINLGLTKRLKYVPFRFTITAHNLQKWPLETIYDTKRPDIGTDLLRHLSFGGEFLFSQSFIFRFGLNKFAADEISTNSRLDFSGSSFGLGLRISRFMIDFSRVSYSSLGNQLLLSISTRF
ncbi:type IX secretion system protein PorQ [bacterium]|nr:MAG: type IX secretion system protein PorQ [bacterium]